MKNARIDSHIIFLLVFPVVFLLTTCFFFAVANAADVTLAWDANSETNLAGYKLYYDGDDDTEMYQGTGANEGDSPVVIYLDDLEDTNSPTFTLTGLEDDQYYYFALTAFDSDGMESDLSDEVGVLTTEEDVANTLAKSTTDAADSDEGDAGGGGGCFITNSVGSNPSSMSGTNILLFLLFIALMGIGCRKRK